MAINLTNEEMERVYDAALELAVDMSTANMAHSRLSTLSDFGGKLLGIGLRDDDRAVLCAPFEDAVARSIDRLMTLLGVKEHDKNAFYEHANKRMEERKMKAMEQMKKAENEQIHENKD